MISDTEFSYEQILANCQGGGGFYSPHNSAGRLWSRSRTCENREPSFTGASGVYKLYKYGFAVVSVALALLIVIVGTLLATRRLSIHNSQPSLVLNPAAALQSDGVGERVLVGKFTIVNGANTDFNNASSDSYLLQVTKMRQKLKLVLNESRLRQYFKNVEIIQMENNGSNLDTTFNVSFVDLPNRRVTLSAWKSVLVQALTTKDNNFSSPFLSANIPTDSILVTESGSLALPNHSSTGSTTTPNPNTDGSDLGNICLDVPPQDKCVDKVLDHCKNIPISRDQRTFYPNLLDMKSEAEVTAGLAFFQMVEAMGCHPNFQSFACAVMQPQCATTEKPLKLCTPFCEAILKSCFTYFNATSLANFNCSAVSTDEPNCFQACSPFDFQCEKTNLCIANTSRCDGVYDCGQEDQSDERFCGCLPVDQVECTGTGKCILEADMCNNYNDCGNWEDEKNCTCEAGLRQCLETGQCLPERFWCDKKFDCTDRSDELGCECSDSDFRCQNGSYCLQNSVRCNGFNDCGDFSDEFDCVCEDYEFRCDEYLCKSYIDHWCNDRPDCLDGSDEAQGCKCKDYQFTCDNGQCIALHRQCDGRPNCDDNSDERNCTCRSNEFDCGDQCIALTRVCDGVSDCPNGTDEHQNCTCGPDQFTCNNGKCVSIAWWCDGHTDCDQGEDETPLCKTTCPSEYRLRCDMIVDDDIVTSRCIHYQHVCDGVAQCIHGEDEAICTCDGVTQFRCTDGTCKNWSAFCNKIVDCPDGSDEPANCTCSFLHQMQCTDDTCYAKEHRCDGKPDCSDASDELSCHCADYLATSNDPAQFSKLCDGVVDCKDLSDELLCPECEGKQFLCGDDSKKCLDERKVCDGITDCPNERDENACYHLSDSYLNIRSWEYDTKGTLFGRLNGDWLPVCAESIQNFTVVHRDEFGAAVCKQLHQIEMVETSIVDDFAALPNQTYLEIHFANATNFYLRPSMCHSRSTIRIVCYNSECGIAPRGSGTTKRIVGGSAVGEGDWPFYASIYIRGMQYCGATILDQTWILTAAHCFNKLVEAGIPMLMPPADFEDVRELVTDFQYDQNNHFTSSKQLAETVVVRVGLVRNSSYGAFEQNSRVSHVIRHSMYDSESGYNDIALLKLETPVKFSAYVMPACLANNKTMGEFGFNGEGGDLNSCYTVGLGSTGWKESGSDVLRQVKLPVMSSNECKVYPSINSKYKVTESQICAGYATGGKDTCQGDSGGPLLCQDYNGRWTLIGVTSRGFSCAKPLTPGLYTKVAAFSDWIHGVTRAYLDPPDSYCKFPNISCVLGDCITARNRCDGRAQCAFREDEHDCPPSTLLLPPTTTSTSSSARSSRRTTTARRRLPTTTLRQEEPDILNSLRIFGEEQNISNQLDMTNITTLKSQLATPSLAHADNLIASGTRDIHDPNSNVIHTCFFDEENICNYDQPQNATTKWFRILSSDIHEDYSMQISIGPLNRPGSKALLVSPFFNIQQFACFKFMLKMEKRPHNSNQEIGQLKVLLERPSGSRLLLYKEVQSHGEYMDEIVVPFTFNGKIRLIFEMTLGGAVGSKVAIDSIRVLKSADSCKPVVCPPGSFDCGGGLFRPWPAWCNGVQECPGNIDEQERCDSLCPPNWFLCKDTMPLQCVDHKQVCDGEFHCVNGEDETYCKCGEDQLRCDDGLCLPVEMFCNGHQDCDDNSDEKHNCTCPLREYNPRLLCDGVDDCSDRSDETQCNRCTSTEFACFQSGYGCISNRMVCNGISDCSQGEDEENCIKLWQPIAFENRKHSLPSSGYVIVKHGNDWNFVCQNSDQTNINYFTQICTSMGYAELSYVTPEGLHPNMTSFVLFQNYSSHDNLLSQVIKIKQCDTPKVYYMKCHSEICGVPLNNQPHYFTNAVNLNPWHVAIYKVYPAKYQKPIKFLCGGSLLNQHWVITAAHCVFGSSTLQITAGAHRRTAATSRDIQKLVDRVVLHPLFDVRNMQHDIALVRLVNPVEFGVSVRPVCLGETDKPSIQDPRQCRVVGWGAEARGGPNRNNLRDVKMQIIRDSSCEDASIMHRYVKKLGVFCATAVRQAQGLCQGDSGGGLICRRRGSGINDLVGLVTYSTDPCTEKPVVFTNVSYYMPWILKHIA